MGKIAASVLLKLFLNGNERMPLTSEKMLVELVQFETLFIQLLGVLAGSLHPLGPQLFKGTHTVLF